MKYLSIMLIFILTSCSLNKDSTYWNVDSFNDSIKSSKPSEISNKNTNFSTMTFEEFDFFLQDYSKKTDYPEIND
ncbi:hypothetical protein PQZ45_01795 [Candidatus Pelagibacter sp.]|nr:hypothetical protein [Candidatus Pelagibacter sp.]|tara:strand:+ start:1016 stop:1240 length:225 start_codon:yes stop_codon:yes gene_type:complete